MKSFIFLSVLSFCFIQLNAQDPAAIVKKLDDEKVKYFQMAETIWKWAEPGYLESKTTALLQENLKKGPGKPGDAEHSWAGLMQFNFITMVEALGGDATALKAVKIDAGVTDKAFYPQ